jgi:hypothetical protein
MTDREVVKFTKYLQKHFPLRCKDTLQVTLCDNDLLSDGKAVRGCAGVVGGSPVIYVSMKFEDCYVYRTIAHEYRHIMQEVNLGWIREKDNKAIEQDAMLFGSKVSTAYLCGDVAKLSKVKGRVLNMDSNIVREFGSVQKF